MSSMHAMTTRAKAKAGEKKFMNAVVSTWCADRLERPWDDETREAWEYQNRHPEWDSRWRQPRTTGYYDGQSVYEKLCDREWGSCAIPDCQVHPREPVCY